MDRPATADRRRPSKEQMTLKRRTVSLVLLGAGACLLAGPAVVRIFAQEQAPNRREFTVRARDYRFAPARIEVTQDDLVKLTIQSEDVAYSLTIDEYRLSKRIPAGGTTTLEFRADQAGTFAFYSNMTNDPRHAQMRGELVVRRR
jgi:heme/copper-type cytochrome/quinol oxidase subunit 2